MAFRRFKQFMNRIVEGNVVHPQNSWAALNIPRTNFDYAKEVGTGLGSNVIMAPVQWVMKAFGEAPIKLEKINSKNKIERILNHQFLELISKPNPFYSYETLIMSTMLSWSIAGNSYWFKVRNNQNQVIELWYLPHWMVTPKSNPNNSTVFIDHYDYNPAGTVFHIPVEDIVHFRFGINPESPRFGLSPLAAGLREVFSDDECANYTTSILRNMGVPGVILSPDGDEVINETQANAVKEKFRQNFTGDNKGNAMVMLGKTKIHTFGFDPKRLALSDTRNISEERVCALLGIPAAVVGFGSGLEQTKVGATMKALINLAWQGNIIPSQRIIAQTIERQLLIDFDNDKFLSVGFDNSKIGALQEDKDAKVKRLSDGVSKGWVKVSDAREAEGLSVEDSDRVYLRPLNLIEVEG